MRSGTRALIFTGAAFAAAAGCGSQAETAGEVPQVVANEGTQVVTTFPEKADSAVQSSTAELPRTTTTQAETTTTAQTRTSQPDTMITDDGIGNLYIGQSKSELSQAGYSLTEGCADQHYGVSGIDYEVAVDLDTNNEVSQISIYGYGPKTAEGIGIGSIKEDVMQTLGRAGLGPKPSVFEGIHGNLDFINVEGEDATLHLEIESMDGDERVSSLTFTHPGQDITLACE